MATLPYPKRLERSITLRDHTPLAVRPIKPEDAGAVTDLFEHLTVADVRFRFFVAMRELSPTLLRRLTRIDYDRDMALVALLPGEPPGDQPTGALAGIVRLSADIDDARAEYAVAVRSDWKGRGLGSALTQEIIAYARGRGIGEIFGIILADNHVMIGMARKLGFTITNSAEDAGVVIARLGLRAGAET
jgi:acetyltransferase